MLRISLTIRASRTVSAALAIALSLTGCSADPSRDRAASAAGDSTQPATATHASPSTDSTGAAKGGGWLARPDGVGPIRVGMTAREALAAAGAGGEDTNPDSACHFLDVAKMPKRLYVMVESGIVTRIDVRDTSVATAEGARVLSRQDSVLATYAGRVQVQPHKYSRGWSYLVVTPPGDSLHRIVFEGDGNLVTMYRVGRVPSVEYVEGCS
jgi:hypothetical protein